MDKYEFNIKVDQIKKLVSKGDFETAMKIADTIDWRRVRSGNLLSMVATVYEKNEDYQEAREILLMAFERAPIGKRLLYKLSELALLEGNVEEAEAYYREFGELSGDDPRQLLLRYMILKAKGAPAQQLIHSLESYTNQEIDEKWLYELAELYSLAGMPDRCVQTCDRIMLMFGLGQYVEKAMELKVQYAPLTTYQMDLVENRDKYEAKLRAVEEEYNLGGGMGVQAREDEYYEDDASDMQMPEEPYDDDYEAEIQEAEVQEDLAREVSRISYDDPAYEQSSEDFGRTEEPEDVRQLGYRSGRRGGSAAIAAGEAAVSAGFGLAETGLPETKLHGTGPAEAAPRPYGRIRWQEEEEDSYGEPVIEEDDAFENEQEQAYGDYYDPQPDESGEKGYGETQYGSPPSDNEGSDSEYENSASGDPDSVTGYGAVKSGSHSKAGSYGETENGNGKSEDAAGETSDDKAMQIGKAGPEGGIPETDRSETDRCETDDLEIENLEEEIEEQPIRNHLMIEARTPALGLQIAIEALKKIQKETGVKKPVAKISGGKLSGLGVEASEGRLVGKDLFIEEAGDLTQKALDELNHLLDRDLSGMNVVLIDNPKQIESLHRNHPELAGKFECIGSDKKSEENKEPMPGTQIPVRKTQLSETKPYGAAVYGTKPYRTDSNKTEACRAGGNGTEAYQTDGHGGEPCQPAGYGADSFQANAYGAEPYPETYSDNAYETERHADDYDSIRHDGFRDEDLMPAQKKGLFGKKKRIYRELPPEEAYEEEDYYENDEEPELVHDQAGPGSHGEEMGIDEFAQYACRYANDIDCSITGKSMLALYERIEIMEEDGVPLTRGNAENIIEEAADRAEKPSIGTWIKSIFANKYDKDGYLILKEEHFIY